jgi:hypothetical protein
VQTRPLLRRLLADKRLRQPTVIEQHRHNREAVTARELEKGVQTIEQMRAIAFVGNVLDEHANAVQPQRLSEAQLAIDRCRIELEPHLGGVDRIGRDVVNPADALDPARQWRNLDPRSAQLHDGFVFVRRLARGA